MPPNGRGAAEETDVAGVVTASDGPPDELRRLVVPTPALILLVGASGSGKTTFAARHFRPTEVLSTDVLRALVGDHEGNQAASRDAFDVLRFVAARRLRARRFTVIDATNLRAQVRRPLLQLARERYLPVAAIVLDIPTEIAEERSASRVSRVVAADVVRKHAELLRLTLPRLEAEGIDPVHVLRSQQEIDTVEIVRERRPRRPEREGARPS